MYTAYKCLHKTDRATVTDWYLRENLIHTTILGTERDFHTLYQEAYITANQLPVMLAGAFNNLYGKVPTTWAALRDQLLLVSY